MHQTRPADNSTEQNVYLKILSIWKVMFLLKYSIFYYMLWSFNLYETYIFLLNNPLHNMNLFEVKQTD